jgi:hypothetical protein
LKLSVLPYKARDGVAAKFRYRVRFSSCSARQKVEQPGVLVVAGRAGARKDHCQLYTTFARDPV